MYVFHCLPLDYPSIIKWSTNVSICPHSYLHPYLPFISPKWGGLEHGVGWGWGVNHRTPKTAAAYKECKGPQPREPAGKPYHIWQQRQNLIFINERWRLKNSFTCEGWSLRWYGTYSLVPGKRRNGKQARKCHLQSEGVGMGGGSKLYTTEKHVISQGVSSEVCLLMTLFVSSNFNNTYRNTTRTLFSMQQLQRV